MPNDREQVDLKQLVKIINPCGKGVGLFRDNENNSVWSLEADEEGDFITRNESDKEKIIESSEAKDWVAASDKSKQAFTLFYKNTPLHKFCASDYDFDDKSINKFGRFVIKKASIDKEFVKKLIKLQSPTYQKQLKKDCPELFNE